MNLRAPLAVAAAALAAGVMVGQIRGHDLDYDRAEFGSAWLDVDRNGCDTRNDILARDLLEPVFKPGSDCVVVAGTLVDPYTGNTIRFVKARAHEVHIDHVYSLAEAWYDGAKDWTPERRRLFANDPENLVATSSGTNLSKGRRGPADWQPPFAPYRCAYAVQYQTVAEEYDLEPTRGEQLALNAMCNRR